MQNTKNIMISWKARYYVTIVYAQAATYKRHERHDIFTVTQSGEVLLVHREHSANCDNTKSEAFQS